MGDLASGLADGLDTFAKYYPQHIKADGLTKIAGGIQRGISYINITGVCKDLFDTNYSKALASISIEGVSWGIKQGIELNASKKTAFALSITTTMIVTLAGILGIREYTQGKIEDIDSLLGSFCEAKQKEWNSKELEPWEKMLNSIYHMDGGFNLTKALNEFLEGKLSLWQSNKMEKWGKMLNAMYLCEGCDMDNPYGKASTIHFVDPLVVDLDGDGITFSSAKDGYAQFDMDKSGFKERVAWLNNSDGFLARDINNNGIIDDGSELFGDRTALKNGGIAANGFSALQDLDDNKDGILDKLDKFFASLCIWQDKDGDGITDTGELTSLAAAGISSLGLNETNINSTDKNGNILDKTSLYTRTDGSQGTIGEFSLGKDTVHSIAVDRTTKEYSHKIQDAPNLLGQGNVVALHRAMAEDATGDLYNYVQKFANAKTEQERLDWLDKILFKWTGNENIAKNSRGKFADGQKLGTLEKLYGQDFIDAYKSHNPSYWNIWEELNRQYIVVRDKVYAQLAMQTFDKELFSGVKIVYGQKSGELAIDIAGVQSLIDKQITRSNSTAAGSLKEFFAMITKLGWTKSIGELDGFVEHFEGKTGMVQFYAYSFGKELVEMASDATSVRGDMNAMAILGNALDNDLFASAKDDVLYGGNGNDRMHGGYYGYGDDIFIGGKGDDFMEGGYGADTYIWNKGDGNDTIDTANGFDKREVDIMRFGEGIGRNDVAILQEGDDLVLQYKETGEKVKIKYWFQSNCYWLKEVVFADGTVLSNKELTALAEIHGTSGNDELHGAGFYGCKYHGDAGDDILVGTHRTDSLYGDEGNDRLFSGAGDDVLVGGLGDDYLEGYYGRDTYVWNKGDGNDTIDAYNYSSMSNKDRLLMERINQAMLDFSMSGDDLICTYTPTNEFITVENWGRGDQYKLASIECADGRLLAADINKKIKLG